MEKIVSVTSTKAAPEAQPKGLPRYETSVLQVARPSEDLVLLRLRFSPPREFRFRAATGTGVAPFRSMLLDLLYGGDQRKIWLFLGSGRPPDLPYHQELLRLSQDFHNFHYVPTLSKATFQEWSGARGWIQEPFLHHFYKRTDYDAYICGVRRMVEDVAELVAEQGVPKDQLHLERYV